MRKCRLWILMVAVGLLLTGILCPMLALAGEAPPQDTLNTVIKRGELIVGTFDFFAPWGFRDAQNNIVGMDPDIAAELAKALGVKLTLVPVPTTQDRINFLLSGKIDVAIANFGATLERARVINFSEPYVLDGIGVIYRKEAKIKSWSDLNGKRVAVTTGSTGEMLLKEQAPKANIQRFDQASTALLAVQQGKADAQIEDYTYTLYHASRDPNKALAALDKPLGIAQSSMGVRKGDMEWTYYINFFIYKSFQSGKLQEIYKKYFGVAPTKVSPTW